ncbi:MAG TPA: SIMPL domain-containing protein, partial [Flavobacterium sp.]|nr:SIMPL domain-containing protein [Flavobacterium sp.]
MRKIFYLLSFALLTFSTMAQNNNNITPQVNVSGEGSVKIQPDYAIISIGSEIKDVDSGKAKKQNDEIIAKMIQVIKKSKIDEKDYQTQRVNLYKSRDYQQKKDYFVANQTITITLRNLDQYEILMSDLMDAGANSINGVEFKSTQTEKFASEIRAKAVLDAKKKAQDYASALDQAIGKALIISDQSFVNTPRVYAMKTAAFSA